MTSHTTTTAKTLLIWDQFGESDLGLYVIDDAPDWLSQCHKCYIGTDNSEAIDALLTRVNDALCEDPRWYSNPDDELAGAWAPHKIDTDTPPELPGNFAVVISGFVP